MRYDADKWNDRWADKASGNGWRVDPWLDRHLALVAPGTALDVACGRGRNAIFLAERGFRVTALDYSAVALRQLEQEAARRGVDIVTGLTDLEQADPDLPSGPFDLLIDFHYLYRPLLAGFKTLVRPGGYVIIRTFSSAGQGSPLSIAPDMVLEPGELPKIFSSWEILVHEEGLEPSKKGGTLAGIVARRPLSAIAPTLA